MDEFNLICFSATVWVASENQVFSLSSSENKTMTLENGKHILGLSNPVLHGDDVVVFVTELGFGGPSIYRLDGSQYTQLLSPEGYILFRKYFI